MQYFFKVTFRSLLRHRFSTIINLTGLTTGLACTFFIFLWVNDELSVNKFHEKDDRLFRVMEMQRWGGEIYAANSTPGILAENLKIDFPEFEYAATTTWINPQLLTYDDQSFMEDGYHVGEDYFNIFSYPLLEGNPDEVLKDKSSIAISRDLAVKFFGSVEEAVGKSIRYDNDRNFQVTGVFENIPFNSTYRFDFVLPFEDFKDDNEWVTHWGNNGPHTFAILREGTNHLHVTAKIQDYIKEKNKEYESRITLFLKKYSEQYLYGNYTNGVLDGGRIEYVRLFTIIAAFILVIACINFMNLSTAKASRKAHEVGVRKAIGGNRGALVRQYIGESVLISTISMILAFLVVIILLPQFNEITDKNIVLEISPAILAIGLGAALITGLLAGSYPAFYLTHFNPAAVLKGEIKNSVGEIWARKGLVVFQFTVTIILIIGVIVIQKQTHYINNKNLGYNRENVIVFNQNGSIGERKDAFLTEIRKIPGVVSVGSTSHSMMSQNNNTMGLEWRGKNPDEQLLFENFRVDETFQETMGMELVAGRWFSKDFSNDTTKILFNEAGVKQLGFTIEEAIGEKIRLWDEHDLEIIGVVKDFHFQSLHTEVDPAFFWLRSPWRIAVRLQAGEQAETIAKIGEVYNNFAPGFIFDPEFMDKSYERLYNSEKRIGTLSSYFAGFAVVISCLGLFGLAAFTAEKRIKEIGIRKVLGASVTNIVLMLSTDFTKLVFISIVIAVPIAYYFMNEWLTGFAYTIDLDFWIFGGAAVLSLVIAWLTVSSQAFRAANVNPAQCLKDE